MCNRTLYVRFFWRCGHFVNYMATKSADAVDQDCDQTLSTYEFDFDLSCQKCDPESPKSTMISTEFSCPDRQPVKEVKAEFHSIYPESAYRPLTLEELWEKRNYFRQLDFDGYRATIQRQRKLRVDLETARKVPSGEWLYILDDESESCAFFDFPKGETEDQDRCAICFGGFDPESEDLCRGGGKRQLPCGHIFGHVCIRDAFMKTDLKMCPLCCRPFSLSKRHFESMFSADLNSRLYRQLDSIDPPRSKGWLLFQAFLTFMVFPISQACDFTVREDAFEGSPLMGKAFLFVLHVLMIPIHWYCLLVRAKREIRNLGTLAILQ